MTDILFTANGASATVLVSGELTSGMVGVPVRFAFDSDWDGLNIVVVFDGSGRRISVPLLTGYQGVLPWEVIAKANTRLHIGAEGRKSDGSIVIPTVWANAGYIREGAAATDDEGNPPTPSIYDQIMAAIEAGKLQGKPGEDGVSPTVSVTEIEGGHRVTITDANKTQVFDVMDGSGFDIEIADDLYTRDQNIALSANMGTVLREKIDTDLLTVQKELQAEIKQRVKTVNGVAPDENGNVEVQGGGGASVYVQEEEPSDAPVGTLWYDTDEESSGGGSGGIAVETDPTVPAWAKQPSKPTYTASEVGALPASTVIPTVPTALKNPHALTFTGAVEATYDGSSPVSVVIPQPSSGGSGGADSVEVLLDFTTTENVTEFHVPIPNAEIAKKLNDALEIRFFLSVPRDTSDTTITTTGKAEIGFNRGWKVSIYNNNAIPAPSTTWVGRCDLFVQYTKATIDGTIAAAAAISQYGLRFQNQNPAGGVSYFENAFLAAEGNYFYVIGTQTMAAGTRLRVGVRK